MTDEIAVYEDDEGVLLIGPDEAIEQFAIDLDMPGERFNPRGSWSGIFAQAGAVSSAAATVAEHSGLYVKITKESRAAINAGKLMKGSSALTKRAVVQGSKGRVTKLVEFEQVEGLKGLLSSPAGLAGLGGLMTQLAAQQAMQEITAYLEAIQQRVEAVLRGQTDAVLSQLVGVGLVIDDAMQIRQHTGGISPVTWSKVQGSDQIIAATQAYALRQIEHSAGALETDSIQNLTEAADRGRKEVEDWTGVLARSVQLQEALTVIELDRVREEAPEQLAQHTEGLRAARLDRRARIAAACERVLQAIETAVRTANEKVLLHPLAPKRIVAATTAMQETLSDFGTALGLIAEARAVTARAWSDAASEVRDNVVTAGEQGIAATVQVIGAAAAAAGTAAEKTGAAVSAAADAAAQAVDAGKSFITGLRPNARKKSTEPGQGDQ